MSTLDPKDLQWLNQWKRRVGTPYASSLPSYGEDLQDHESTCYIGHIFNRWAHNECPYCWEGYNE